MGLVGMGNVLGGGGLLFLWMLDWCDDWVDGIRLLYRKVVICRCLEGCLFFFCIINRVVGMVWVNC